MMDYRCTPYCPSYANILQRKSALLKQLRKKHPRARDIYHIVNKRNTDEHSVFFHLYNYKCVYCGCSTHVVPAELFNIDHLKPRADKTTPANMLNALDNLVLSCRNCNANKSDYWLPELSDCWSPDGEGIANIFIRDDLYNIRIAPEYASSNNARALYQQLKLGEQYHRLDYLIMAIGGYLDSLPQGSQKRASLSEVLMLLTTKRNQVGIRFDTEARVI